MATDPDTMSREAKNDDRDGRIPLRRATNAHGWATGCRVMTRLLLASVLMMLPFSAMRAGEEPGIEAHQSRWIPFGFGVALYTAHGGSTDAPPDELGCAPWVRTGNRRYFWQVPCKEGKLQTEPAEGVSATQDTLLVVPNVAGTFSVHAYLQEEWRDSGENPRTIYWPEAPEPTP